MDGAGQLASLITLSLGASWASGINCYGAILALGLMGMQGAIHLPPDLQVLAHPWVIVAAGLMYLVEFFVDKVPGLDTAWDTVHTLIRIPVGALLAAGSLGQADPALMVAAGILGGTLSASTHAIKAGTRVLANTSPEPMSNWLLSLGEDAMVLGGIWTAVKHPWLFAGLLVCFLLVAVWLFPKLWRGITLLWRRLATLLAPSAKPPH